MTPRERAESLKKLVTVDIHQDFWDSIRQQIEQAILADRQALQSEIEKRLKAAHETWMHQGIIEGPTQCGLLYNFRREIQSVFAQQSQPEEGKPEIEFDSGCPQCAKRLAGEPELCQPKTCPISKAESDRRVLAEREACAKLADQYMEKCYEDIDKVKGWKRQAAKENEMMNFGDLAAAIRARSNHPEGKQCGNTFRNLYEQQRQCTLPFGHSGSCMFTGYDPDCSTCVHEAKEEAEEDAKRVERMISSADRIATLHEWQARDAKIIQQLNESNNALSLKVAQLEKEKNELTQKLETLSPAKAMYCNLHGLFSNHSCKCELCAEESASRKA